MAKWIKNADTETHVWCGQEISASSYYEIPVLEYLKWANDSTLLLAVADGIAVVAKDDSGTTDFSDINEAINYLKDGIPKEVTTQFEKDDKRLKLACAEAEFDGNGDAEISIPVPSGGRYIAGGNAFTDAFCAGDKVTACSLVDVDDLLGYGPETVLANYHDSDVASANQGWYFEPRSNNTGWIEIEPIGGYGHLPGGMYLELYFKKAAGSTASKVFVNIWWGKLE